MAYLTLALSVLIPSLIGLLARFLLQPSKPDNFPPGPPTIPFLGNLHQIPLIKPFVQFAEWSRTHGAQGLVGLRLGPSGKAIVLNNWKSVRDLLDQRGAIYSSRPYVPIVEYVVPPPGDIHLVFMPYGMKWRKARKTITDFLKDEEVDKLLPIQDAESSQMIWELLHEPKRWNDHVLRYFGAVIMDSVFGTRDRGGEKIKAFFCVQDEWASMLDQGAVPPYDIFPFLRYIPDFLTPWRGWKSRAASLKQRQSALYHELFEEAKERVGGGKSQDSFVSALLRDREEDGYSPVELEYITGFLMEGGSDTTAGAFETFILAMAAHPEIQKKAQTEVDSVFGSEGVQAGKVKAENLPYLKACFLETLRWRPGFPLSIPHATTKDDTYKGYVIPANTTILMNIWAIHHDPDEYADPHVFSPDRFSENPLGIKLNGISVKEALADQSRRPTYGFGAGRRVCAGQRMAENSMMMTMSKLLWSFDIVAEMELDTSVQTAFKDAILTGPKEFPVSFRPRDEGRSRVIEVEWEKADGFLEGFE
ncbi:cytochrome P450 [Xylariales sp. AK1849]|nr:cytochrome P450 [Xylariales sp. AK1849]